MNLQQVKVNLLEKKAEIESRLERTHKHIYHKDEPVSANFNEQIKQTENDELVRALEQEGREELRQINKALQRLDSDEYTLCTGCGGEIGEQRLLAIPYTDLCIECASAADS
ncbi:MAG: TraR/DksA family transcriptional regulator [Gammaproteobacteria bacterium]|nr:TraR/DksA family transcriptional regulator [Pseudomonadales bacterium]MCP5345425.1 TraR/DksA family transcriptional regulator [Pseudomonadales bacterium]